MLSSLFLVALWVSNGFVIAIPTANSVALPTVETPVITPSPAIRDVQGLAAISASISSLLDILQPPSSITSELTAIPTSVLTALEGPNVMSAFDELYSSEGDAWFTALPSGAESWVLGLPAHAATILPQVISLQSLANTAFTSSSSSSSTRSTPTTNDSPPAATATVTSTSSAPAKRGLTQGQQIGAIIGSAAVAALAVTLGVMIYDARRRRSITKTMRAHVAEKNTSRPPLISLVTMRRQQSQASAATATPGSTKLETGNAAHNGLGLRGVKDSQEIYELHSPEIAYSGY